MGLQQFERRLERLVEGVFAKAFRSGLEPVELGRRLVRQMDRDRQLGPSGQRVAPNRFTFRLSPDDHARLEGSAAALVPELEEAAREHARDERYSFLGRVEVLLVADPSVAPGVLQLDAEVRAAPGGHPTASLVLSGGQRHALGESTTIGRLDTCEVRLDDPTVSRTHARVVRVGDAYEVQDLGSRNGTKVNGVGIARRPLADGDVLLIGAVPVRFEAV